MPALAPLEHATPPTTGLGPATAFHLQLHMGTPGPDGLAWLAPGQSLFPIVGHPVAGGVALEDTDIAWDFPAGYQRLWIEMKAFTIWPPTGSRWDGLWWVRAFDPIERFSLGDTLQLALRGFYLPET